MPSIALHWKRLLLYAGLFAHTSVMAQQADTDSLQADSGGDCFFILPDSSQQTPVDLSKNYIRPYRPQNFIMPAALFASGLLSLKCRAIRSLNEHVKREIWINHPHRCIHIDNYLQFTPAVAVYGLNMAGIRGRHNASERSMIYLMSNVFVNAMVYPLKNTFRELRPDGSARTSFPSGHTAEAFASAEFLREEYKDVSPWYGIAGYAVATTTGFLRVYNNKHWVGDVVAGAGIGIASTKMANILYPILSSKLFKERLPNTTIMPFYQHRSAGLSMLYAFSR